MSRRIKALLIGLGGVFLVSWGVGRFLVPRLLAAHSEPMPEAEREAMLRFYELRAEGRDEEALADYARFCELQGNPVPKRPIDELLGLDSAEALAALRTPAEDRPPEPSPEMLERMRELIFASRPDSAMTLAYFGTTMDLWSIGQLVIGFDKERRKVRR